MKKLMFFLMCAILVMSGTACSKEDSKPGSSLNLSQSNDAGKAQTQNPGKTPKPVKTKEGKTLVTFSLVVADPYTEEAVQKFEAANPDIDIELKPLVKSQSISDIEMTKYYNQMRTELLSGKGSDLYQAEGDLIGPMANKKLLANLSELMAADSTFDKSQYFDNILEGSKMNGNLYGMPVSFSFTSLLLGDEDAIQAAGISIDDKTWTWEQFWDYAGKLVKNNKGSSRYALRGFPPEQMLTNRVYGSYPNWVDESSHKANFESDAFKSLMEQTKNMYTNKVLTSKKTKRNDAFFLPAPVSRPQDYFNRNAWFKKGKLYLSPQAAGEKAVIPFNAYSMMVINEKSPAKEAAWKFIHFLMSEEMQSSPNNSGFPINKAAYKKKVDELRKSVKNGWLSIKQDVFMMDDEGEIKQPESVQVTDQDFDNLDKLVSGANALAVSNSKVEDIVYEEAKAYFSGQKSADEVAKLIQNRVMTYLNE